MSADADDPRLLAGRIAERVAPGTRLLVALDNDGTIAPIAPRPELARLAPGAREAIATLSEVADVVVLSGRGLEDLIERFAGLRVTIVAEHGLRHRTVEGEVAQLVPGLAATTLARLGSGLAELLEDAGDGWLIEDKGVTIAVHHRLVADEHLEPTLTRVRELLEAAAGTTGVVQSGKAVLELRPAGADKGAALRTIADGRADAFVVMVGDDLTDEAALSVAEQRGGIGVLVADAPRASAASARLDDPAAVVELLTALAERLTQGR